MTIGTMTKQIMEQKFHLSEKNYRALVESSPDGIITLNAEGYITDCNQSICDLLDLHRDEIVTKHISELLTGPKPDLVQPGYTPNDTKETNGEELLFTGKEDNSISLWAKGATLQDKTGSHSGSIMYLRDITDRKRIDQLKDEFIALVSHELRSPLTVVIGALNTALSEAEKISPQDMRWLLLDAAWEAESLSRMLDNFIELIGTKAKNLRLHLELTSIRHLVEDTIRKVQRQYPDHSFKIDIASDTPLVYADQLRLERVMYNLLENAAKYSLPERYIHVCSEPEHEWLTVSIRDQGMGISKHAKANLFRPFQRLEELGQERIKGTGLGLVVCQRLVEAHGGSIWVESKRRKGSTFFFTLPLVPDELDLDEHKSAS